MLNINRLNAVISKIGKANNETLVKNLVEDIWNDYYIKYNFPISNYDKANDFLNNICLKFVNENL